MSLRGVYDEVISLLKDCFAKSELYRELIQQNEKLTINTNHFISHFMQTRPPK